MASEQFRVSALNPEIPLFPGAMRGLTRGSTTGDVSSTMEGCDGATRWIVYLRYEPCTLGHQSVPEWWIHVLLQCGSIHTNLRPTTAAACSHVYFC